MADAFGHRVRILIITSCTGEKREPAADADLLTLDDFRLGPEHVAARERACQGLTPAGSLYTGSQHVRLMRGIERLRSSGLPVDVDLAIVSAGYGVVPEHRDLASYEATFIGMSKRERRAWATTLGIPESVRSLLESPFDLALVLLGNDYLDAAQLPSDLQPGGPVIAFCAAASAASLGATPGVTPVPLDKTDAKTFQCGLVGLKGEVAARLLEAITTGITSLEEAIDDPRATLARYEPPPKPVVGKRLAAIVPNPALDVVISLPESWRSLPHRQRLRYFIPDWDDLVDPNFDFTTETHSGGRGDWTNEVYAHQLYPAPSYDGILVSKIVAEKPPAKAARINELGVHRYLRVPDDLPVMGDCGAFGYIGEEVPPYTTPEILEYYTRLGFNYGISLDHLIVAATAGVRQFRYDLTLHNAEEFLVEHRKLGLPWEPVGAVQGWDPQSYADAAIACVKMGYRYLALGGLVRTRTSDVLKILEAVHPVVPESVGMHLLGLARLESLDTFAKLGVRSVDSASLLRRAWLSHDTNYLTDTGQFYSAVRVPEAGKSHKAVKVVNEGRGDLATVQRHERDALAALRAYDREEIGIEEVLGALITYDTLISPNAKSAEGHYRKTLEDRPWRACGCEICQRDGIEVIIFRGNNRNRRRGFHNTWAFYRLVQQALAGDPVGFTRANKQPRPAQLTLPL
jgi:hypothetical protein